MATSGNTVKFIGFSEAIGKFKEFKGILIIGGLLLAIGGYLSWCSNNLGFTDILTSFGGSAGVVFWGSFLASTGLYLYLFLTNLRFYKAKLEDKPKDARKQMAIMTALMLFNCVGLGVMLFESNNNKALSSPEYVRAQRQIETNNKLIESFSRQIEGNGAIVQNNSEAREETDTYYYGGTEKVQATQESDKEVFSENKGLRKDIARLQEENAKLTRNSIAPIESGDRVFVGGVVGSVLGLFLPPWAVLTIMTIALAFFQDLINNTGTQLIAPGFMTLSAPHSAQGDKLELDAHFAPVMKKEIEKFIKEHPEQFAGGGSSPSPSKAGQEKTTIETGPNGEKITRYHTKEIIEADPLAKANAAKKDKGVTRRGLIDHYLNKGGLNDTQIAEKISQKHGLSCDRSTVTRRKNDIAKGISPDLSRGGSLSHHQLSATQKSIIGKEFENNPGNGRSYFEYLAGFAGSETVGPVRDYVLNVLQGGDEFGRRID